MAFQFFDCVLKSQIWAENEKLRFEPFVFEFWQFLIHLSWHKRHYCAAICGCDLKSQRLQLEVWPKVTFESLLGLLQLFGGSGGSRGHGVS